MTGDTNGYKWIQLVTGLPVSGVNATLNSTFSPVARQCGGLEYFTVDARYRSWRCGNCHIPPGRKAGDCHTKTKTVFEHENGVMVYIHPFTHSLVYLRSSPLVSVYAVCE